MSTPYDKEFRNKVRRARYENMHLTTDEVGRMFGVSGRSVRRWCQELDEGTSDTEIIEENIRVQKNHQRLLDRQRIERKSFREYARAEGMLEELHTALITALTNNKMSSTSVPEYTKVDDTGNVGIIQLSDNHMNELIKDIDGNDFDFHVAAKRLHKLAEKALNTFASADIDKVVFAFTGDLLNSDRRIDEVTEAAYPRANATLLATDLYQQMICHVAQYYPIMVASITGNESRCKEYVSWTDYLASDSYDITIHHMLSYILGHNEYIEFAPIANPLECVLEINNTKILMVHGHGHKGIANPSKISTEVEKIKARYASKGVIIDYVIMGHIHDAHISDNFARSASLPGQNAYAERALNTSGRASQNIYVVNSDGSIDGMKVDLQNTDGYDGYEVNKALIAYDRNSHYQQQGTVVINSVLT